MVTDYCYIICYNAQRKKKTSTRGKPISCRVCGEEGLKPKYLLLGNVKIAALDMFIIKGSDPEIINAHY